MANETNNPQPANPSKGASSEASPEVQRQMLMQRAKVMGLNVSPNIGLETLRAKVQAALEAENVAAADKVPDPENEADEEDDAPTEISTESAAPKKQQLRPETEAQKRVRIQKEAMKLVRIRLTCMNPNKKDLKGQIVTVCNKYIGTVKKFVPFVDHEDGYHVPFVIYQQLKDAKYLHIQTNDRPRPGAPQVKTGYVPEFAIEVLPQLTEKELKALAQRQAMAQGTAPATVDNLED